MSKKPLDRGDRLEQQYRRLGTREPSCVTCGFSNPFALQKHHLAGSKHHDDTVIECANCHSNLSDLQRDHVPPDLAVTSETLLTIGRYLRGLADVFAMLATTLRHFGEWLIEEATKGD